MKESMYPLAPHIRVCHQRRCSPSYRIGKERHEIIRPNVGDPLAFDGLPTPSHMISAYKLALDRQDMDTVLHMAFRNLGMPLRIQSPLRDGLQK